MGNFILVALPISARISASLLAVVSSISPRSTMFSSVMAQLSLSTDIFTNTNSNTFVNGPVSFFFRLLVGWLIPTEVVALKRSLWDSLEYAPPEAELVIIDRARATAVPILLPIAVDNPIPGRNSDRTAVSPLLLDDRVVVVEGVEFDMIVGTTPA
jgi:hypothetical protein